jgi:hypothetical protein
MRNLSVRQDNSGKERFIVGVATGASEKNDLSEKD